MCEILFRGKRKDNGEWIEGSLILTTAVCQKAYIVDSCWCEHGKVTEEGFADFNWLNAFEVFPETVGQYTGTNNGADKLFEGDIVEWYEDYDDAWGYSQTVVGRSVVVWDTDNFCWAFKTDDKYIQMFNDWIWNSSYIIGNIHDNPELLKGEEAERALKNGEPVCDYTKTDWNDCCECSAKDHCDKYNERSEIIGDLLGEAIGAIKNEGR